MMMQPTPYGNVDPDWPPMRQGPGGQPHFAVVQTMEAYPNLAPRKCVWAMLLLSSLLVLRLQQERYAEAMRYYGGVPDTGHRFPWEFDALVSGNDTYESTFLAPIMRRASTFLNTQPNTPAVITGPSRVVAMGGGALPTSTQDRSPPGVPAVAPLAGPLASMCHVSPGTSCLLGVQRAASIPLLARPPKLAGASCYKFVVGTSLFDLQPLSANTSSTGSPLLCMRSKRVLTVIPQGAETAVVAWEPNQFSSQNQLVPKCFAVVRLQDAHVSQTAMTGAFSTAFFDNRSSSIATVSHSDMQIVLETYDATTLQPRWRYRLPFSVAWLLRAPRMTDGFVLFVGTEQPFVGTLFVVDLIQHQVFEEDPPQTGSGGRRKTRRRILPHNQFVEDISGGRHLDAAPSSNAKVSVCQAAESRL